MVGISEVIGDFWRRREVRCALCGELLGYLGPVLVEVPRGRGLVCPACAGLLSEGQGAAGVESPGGANRIEPERSKGTVGA